MGEFLTIMYSYFIYSVFYCSTVFVICVYSLITLLC
jgi:hypothetical protein